MRWWIHWIHIWIFMCIMDECLLMPCILNFIIPLFDSVVLQLLLSEFRFIQLCTTEVTLTYNIIPIKTIYYEIANRLSNLNFVSWYRLVLDWDLNPWLVGQIGIRKRFSELTMTTINLVAAWSQSLACSKKTSRVEVWDMWSSLWSIPVFLVEVWLGKQMILVSTKSKHLSLDN